MFLRLSFQFMLEKCTRKFHFRLKNLNRTLEKVNQISLAKNEE
jgi:hypothetical protein